MPVQEMKTGWILKTEEILDLNFCLWLQLKLKKGGQTHCKELLKKCHLAIKEINVNQMLHQRNFEYLVQA